MDLKVVLDEDAIMPERAHDTDAGLDFFTPFTVTVPKHGFKFIDTGVHVQLPRGTRGHICSKSGLSRNFGLFCDGTVDEGYTGTIGVTVMNISDVPRTFIRGDKICQMVIEPVLYPKPVRVNEISGGERGDNGYGSTGR